MSFGNIIQSIYISIYIAKKLQSLVG